MDRQTDRISLYGASFVTVEAPLLRAEPVERPPYSPHPPVARSTCRP